MGRLNSSNRVRASFETGIEFLIASLAFFAPSNNLSGFPLTYSEALDDVNHGFYKNLVLAAQNVQISPIQLCSSNLPLPLLSPNQLSFPILPAVFALDLTSALLSTDAAVNFPQALCISPINGYYQHGFLKYFRHSCYQLSCHCPEQHVVLFQSHRDSGLPVFPHDLRLALTCHKGPSFPLGILLPYQESPGHAPVFTLDISTNMTAYFITDPPELLPRFQQTVFFLTIPLLSPSLSPVRRCRQCRTTVPQPSTSYPRATLSRSRPSSSSVGVLLQHLARPRDCVIS